MNLPTAFIQTIARLEPERGLVWLEGLPALVQALCEQWALEADGAVLHGGLSLVVPVLRNRERCVLRVAFPHGSTPSEVSALRAWNGRGAVRLLEVDVEHDALLLERLDHTRSLGTLGLHDAFGVAGGLLRRLAIPAPDDVPRLSTHALNLSNTLETRWLEGGKPCSRSILERAVNAARILGPVAGNELVHWDLYDDNVLAGVREPWLAIDPKVIAGDVEFGLAQLLWRRLEQMPTRSEFERAWNGLLGAGDFDAERARGWTLVRVVDYWLWGLGIGLTIDPARCAVLAEWL
jgi:streptomycin 6-kinase